MEITINSNPTEKKNIKENKGIIGKGSKPAGAFKGKARKQKISRRRVFMRINQNISAMTAWRALKTTDRHTGRTMEKLSSGLRINRAADDAAGLAISERMRSQIIGLEQSVSNAQDGISLIQTAEGALDETHAILNRIRELTIQAANEVNEKGDVLKIQDEVNALIEEIDRISKTTEFNTKTLIDGNLDHLELQIGANAGQSIEIALKNMDAEALGLVEGSGEEEEEINLISFLLEEEKEIDFSQVAYQEVSGQFYTEGHVIGFSSDNYYVAEKFISAGGTIYNTADQVQAGNFVTVEKVIESLDQETLEERYSTGDKSENYYFTEGGTVLYEPGQSFENPGEQQTITNTEFGNLIQILDGAIDRVSEFRSELGAAQNRLEHTISNLEVARENLSAAESRIRDADMALKMMELTRHQIMKQAGTAMMAQANMRPQAILQLLG